MTEVSSTVVPSRLGINRCALAGAAATALFFLACWLLALLGLPASHAFITLFTIAAVTSVVALCFGGLSALAAGALGGALIAASYNWAGRLLSR